MEMRGQPGPTLEVAARFVGPPGSGHGGYSCGTFARLVDGPAEVTLRRPVPLDSPFATNVSGDEATVADDEGTLAEVSSIDGLAGVEPPLRPGLDEAARCSARSPFLTDRHPYPGCFVCGSEHPDGLGVYAGPTDADPDVAAAPLDPGPSLPAAAGGIAPEIVWAALDCPSYTPRLFREGVPHLLGRFAVERLAPVPGDEPSVIVGWEIERDGRKLHSASAVLSPEGDLLARSRALWIAVKG